MTGIPGHLLTLRRAIGKTPLPDVYALAAFLGQRYECTHLIDLGCGHGRHLAALHPAFEVIGIDSGEAIRYCRSRYDFGQWLDCDLDTPAALALPPEVLRHAIIICDGVTDHLQNPDALLARLHTLLDDAPVALLTTPAGDLAELVQRLETHGLRVEFAGHAAADPKRRQKKTLNLVVLASHRRPAIERAPEDFRVVALMAAYNEADIILPSLRYLIAQGIEVYLIDNWSTDGTFEQAQTLLGTGLIGLERFPATPPVEHAHDWPRMLDRKAHIAQEIGADWYIHHDVDELREGPWPDFTLKDAIYLVDRCGYNCIDFTVIEFGPVDNTYPSGTDFGDHFRHYTFGSRPGLFSQLKAWKRTPLPVELGSTGGHRIGFENRRVYPYNFLLKHYPLRSSDQSRIKVLERQHAARRIAQQGHAGHHRHYDHIQARNERFFEALCRKTLAEYHLFDPETFYTDYLAERIARVGLVVAKPPFLQRLQRVVMKYARLRLGVFQSLVRRMLPGTSASSRAG